MNKQICTPRIYGHAFFLVVLLLFSVTLAVAQAIREIQKPHQPKLIEEENNLLSLRPEADPGIQNSIC